MLSLRAPTRQGLAQSTWVGHIASRQLQVSRGGAQFRRHSHAASLSADIPSNSGTPSGDSRPILSPDGIIDPDGTVVKQAPLDPEEQALLWKAAIKAPMYSVGLAPILVTAMAAWANTGVFMPLRTLGFCVAAIAIIAWLNLSNDVFDSMTGVDKTKPESVVNLTGSRRRVFVLAHALLLLGGGLLFHLLATVVGTIHKIGIIYMRIKIICLTSFPALLCCFEQPNPSVAKALYAAICAGYLYQGPPFRWSYLGLGEPLCFLAFGPLATCAFYLAQIPPALAVPAAGASVLSVLPPSVIALSVLIGISTTVILFCSHFHQVEGDRAAGKMSPLVRLGTHNGASTLKFVVGFTYAVTIVLSLFGVFPFAVWTSSMVAYGLAAEMVKLAETHPDEPALLRPLKMLATRWHIGFTAMLALGLLVAKLMVI